MHRQYGTVSNSIAPELRVFHNMYPNRSYEMQDNLPSTLEYALSYSMVICMHACMHAGASSGGRRSLAKKAARGSNGGGGGAQAGPVDAAENWKRFYHARYVRAHDAPPRWPRSWPTRALAPDSDDDEDPEEWKVGFIKARMLSCALLKCMVHGAP